MSALDQNARHGFEQAAFTTQTIHTNGFNKTLIVNTGPCLLIGASVFNSNASGQFVQLFDGTAAPANGTQPAAVFAVAGFVAASAAGNLGLYYGSAGRPFLNGCVICISSTSSTYTAAGANDCYIDAEYVVCAY